MNLIESSLTISRLRVVLENLFQTNNQVIFLGRLHPTSEPLTLQASNRIYSCITDLGGIIGELEPRKIDTGCLTLEDALTLEGYAEIRRGLIKSWEFIEARERAILQQAANRQAGSTND